VRVADFTQGVAGPMTAMLLADLGAEVVKVEPPGGDRLREQPGYLAFNRGKQVLTLDTESIEGRAAALALVAGADVAVFDHSPERLAALGFGAEQLMQAHPGLVHAWMPPYGVTGRWSELPPHHSLLAAVAGWGWRQGADGDAPTHLVLPGAWYGQAIMGATAIGAALYERSQSGRGQGLVVSGLHGFAQVGGPSRILGIPPLPRPIPRGANPRYRLYRCADGEFFFLGALFANFYRKVFEALGHGDAFELFLADDEGARNLLDEVFATRSRGEWIEHLRAHGVPCAPVGRREAWFDSAAIRDAGLRLAFDHPELGEVAMPAPPISLSATPARVRGLPQPIAAPPAWTSRPVAQAAPRRTAPLAGVKVLNLGTVIAGAYPSAILSSFGADVVKIEPPEGDPFRYDPMFLLYNRGCRAMGVDLKRPEGREAFLELVRRADVVIDNFRLGVRDRLGIGYEVLKAVNPRIISCSVTGYGDHGVDAQRSGFDPLLQAESGMMAAQGGDDDPVFLTMAMNDVASAGVVCASVIAALNARERTGLGQEIRTSLKAQSLLFQLAELVTYAGRPENDRGGYDCVGVRALHRYYACADGWIGIACERAAEAAALGKALGTSIPDPEAALAEPRDGALAAQLEAAFAERPRTATLEALLLAGAPAAPCVRMHEVFDDAWLQANRYLELWEHPVQGPVVGVRSFGDLLATPGGMRGPAPELAEHSAEVLREFGFTPEAIAALIASGGVFERKVEPQPA
jgi:crotonobetainyl-CoA:carnitine CoA-transferase CaiB-like acyl-CoA transferase